MRPIIDAGRLCGRFGGHPVSAHEMCSLLDLVYDILYFQYEILITKSKIMSFREKSAWIILITLVVLTVAYLVHMPRPFTLSPARAAKCSTC